MSPAAAVDVAAIERMIRRAEAKLDRAPTDLSAAA